MLQFKFKSQKAREAFLYIVQRLKNYHKRPPDLHQIFKTLYFADQKHLVRYGRPILGDHYIAMEHGPVPSKIYDWVKAVRGDSFFPPTQDLLNDFAVDNRFVFPKREADLNELSESEVECLDESFEENKDLSFDELKKKSHDEAYHRALKNDIIHYRDIARAGGADRDTIELIRLNAENEKIFDL